MVSRAEVCDERAITTSLDILVEHFLLVGPKNI